MRFGQSADLCRHAGALSRRQFSRRVRSRSRPTRSHLRLARSARLPSGASRCWVDPRLSACRRSSPRARMEFGSCWRSDGCGARSENKQRAYPASVDSIPTSANQEDHRSDGGASACRLADMAENAANSSHRAASPPRRAAISIAPMQIQRAAGARAHRAARARARICRTTDFLR